MKIHDQNPIGGLPGGSQGASGAKGPGGAPEVGGKGGRAAEVRGGEQQNRGPDRVSLSNLAASVQPEAMDREAEVDRLSELFDRGIYEADAGAVAESLIDEALMKPLDEPEGGSGERE